jgi:hypothetical protein
VRLHDRDVADDLPCHREHAAPRRGLRPGCFPRGRSPRRHYVSRPSWPVRHRDRRAWPGIPAPAWAASIQPVTWLGIGREELVSQARTGGRGPGSARPCALRSGVDRSAGPAVEAQRPHDGERRGGGEDLHVRGGQHAVYFAMTGAATPGGGVEAGFTWSFRAGPRADRGPARSECGPRPG